MSAQPKDVIVDAKESDLLDLWAPKTRTLVVGGKQVYVRALTAEERVRCEKIESPTNHDALVLAIAMGCVNSKGEPMFGPYGQALEKLYKRAPDQNMQTIARAIFELSGMAGGDTDTAKGN